VPEIDLRKKGNLLSDISQTYYLLNGQTSGGHNTSYGSLFKRTRYSIILLAAITLENFKDQTENIQGTPFYNFYRLKKVADFLRLDYDRTKQAKKIYEELENMGEVQKETTEDNRTYISLTEKGINRCFKKLEELHNLRNYFARLPSLQEKYLEDGLIGRVSTDLQSKSYSMTMDENNVEMLIKSISE
jgi:predicted transcriptional regulator